jgi:hypothetical protein
MRLTVKSINDELARRGHTARLAKAAVYFYFKGDEVDQWLYRTVQVPTVNALSMDGWMREFERLRAVNTQVLVKGSKRAPARKPRK